MAMASGSLAYAGGGSSRSDSSPPGLRKQLQCITLIYQTLTNLYFLLIEQNASTGINVSTKNAIVQQTQTLLSYLRGEDVMITSAVNRSQIRNATHTQPINKNVRKTNVTSDLRPEHAKRIKEIPFFQNLLRSSSNMRNASSSSTFIPNLGQTIEAIEELDLMAKELMQRADEHAINQAKIRQLVEQIEERDSNMVQSIRRLSVLRDRCGRLVKLGKEEEESIRIAEEKPLGYKEILQYARTLSQTTTAPPGFKLPVSDEYPAQSGENANEMEKPKKKLYQLANEDEDETEAGSGRIPAKYQNKLPFPSIDTIRRGASIIQTPTWEMFQKGILQVDQQEVNGEHQDGDEKMEQEQSEQYQHMPAQYQRRPPQQQQQPAEEEEDGFGLDLN